MAGRAACVVLLCIALFGAAYASQQQYNDGPGYEHSGPDGYHHGPDGHDDHGPEGYGHPGDDGYGHGGDGYDQEPHYEHQPESYYKALKLNLQEERITNVNRSASCNDGSTWTSVLKCAEDEKTHPAQCFEQPDSTGYNHDGYGHDDLDFMSAIIQEPAGECVFRVTKPDNNGTTILSHAARVDITCTIMSTAEKCGYGLPSGASFNATGYLKTCKAISCDKDYISTGLTQGGLGRKLLADNTADYSTAARNGTVYEGTALLVEAVVTSCVAGRHHELAEKLHNAKLEYVGGFVNGELIRETVELDEYGSFQRTLRLPDLPFITGGSLKLTMKDY